MNAFRLKFVNKDINTSSTAITHQFALRRCEEVPLKYVNKTIIMIVDPTFRYRDIRRGDRLPYIGGSTKISCQRSVEIVDPDPIDKSIISLGHIVLPIFIYIYDGLKCR